MSDSEIAEYEAVFNACLQEMIEACERDAEQVQANNEVTNDQ